MWSDNPIADCDRVIVSLYSSEVVESVLQHLKSSMQQGQIVVDTTTGNPDKVSSGNRDWPKSESVIWIHRFPVPAN